MRIQVGKIFFAFPNQTVYTHRGCHNNLSVYSYMTAFKVSSTQFDLLFLLPKPSGESSASQHQLLSPSERYIQNSPSVLLLPEAATTFLPIIWLWELPAPHSSSSEEIQSEVFHLLGVGGRKFPTCSSIYSQRIWILAQSRRSQDLPSGLFFLIFHFKMLKAKFVAHVLL